ncbi:ribulose-phosphate 3-epimerase [uncultured Phocaeicola sp.]|mgnify:CR=1 FL=1|uniref:ribulose-phosphate 3-epimerase n=1 Tax=uncultured Phocaeicola sp. TaxID=990718 RepID=UPI001433CF06|nr:ribulose-phosphate 3-epimerase [uncultured Phocaeicola sp.]GFH97775.1 D-allulose-6-phosphate 3-epimerase [Bacteroidaceae bacterium]
MKKTKLSVSMMCADLVNLEHDIRILEMNHVDYLHIDIMDASFVPNLTFGPDFVNAIRNITTIPLDIHLLMEHPRIIVRSMNIRENDIVTIHCECKESIMENVAFIKQKGAKFGLALNPDTSIEEVRKYLPYVDVILLMLIVPGFAGSAMIHGMMEKVGETKLYLHKHKFDNIEICVDGSVSCERAKYMRELGASIFVGGTAGIFRKGLTLEQSIAQFLMSIQ